MSLNDNLKEMSIHFEHILHTITTPYTSGNTDDAPLSPTYNNDNLNEIVKESVELQYTAKDIDLHMRAFFEEADTLQDKLNMLTKTVEPTPIYDDELELSEVDMLERDVLCILSELRRGQQLVKNNVNTLITVSETMKKIDANNPTKTLLEIKTPNKLNS